MKKENINQEQIDRAQKFLADHFGAKPDPDLAGGLSVIHQRGWILDAEGQGWKLSEIMAAFFGGGGEESIDGNSD